MSRTRWVNIFMRLKYNFQTTQDKNFQAAEMKVKDSDLLGPRMCSDVCGS